MAEAPAEATPAAPAAEAPPPAPAAAPQLPVPAPELDKRAWLASATDRLRDAADAEAAAGKEEAEAEPETAAEEPAEPAAEANKKAKPDKGKKPEPKLEEKPPPAAAKKAEAPAPNAEKLERLKVLTKELGLEFDGGKVSVKEQAAFRESKQRAKQALEAERAQLQQELTNARGQFQAELTEAAEWRRVKEGKDYQGIARMMGHKDWNGLQEDVIKVMSDPNYLALEQQRQEVAQMKAEREREKQEFAAAQERQQRAQAENALIERLAGELKQSEDKLCKALAGDPLFVRAVLSVQRDNWDGSTTLRPEDAVRAKRRGPTIEAQMRGLYDALREAYGDSTPEPAAAAEPAETEAEPAAEPEPAKAAPKPGARPKPRTAVVPASRAAEPSTNGKMNERDWLERGRKMLERAAREEKT